VWSGTVPLAPGDYIYKFVVDGEWFYDLEAEQFVDETGNYNNKLCVDESGNYNNRLPVE